MENRMHGGGNITYWSVYRQVWVTSHVRDVPDRELAAMPQEERDQVLAEVWAWEHEEEVQG